jgi:hypothetical protein
LNSGTTNHAFFNGVGLSGENSSSLPPQAIPDSKKTPKWVESNLDRMEQIGIKQLHKNIEFADYYKMIRGEMVLSDYGLSDKTQEFISLVNEVQLPSNVRHYDFLGMIVNQIVGEYGKFKDGYVIDTRDSFSQNEYVRDKTNKVKEFATKTFEIELQKKLIEAGVDQDQQFESEEEKQKFMQELEQRKAQLIDPEAIERDMNKNWKTKAAEWAQKTLEKDRDRFDMDAMNNQEITDYILTGRFFRHYHVGYDFYRPETWSPMTTFFSEDVGIQFPQDGEYVGRIHFLSPSDIMDRWGSKLTAEDHQRLSGYYQKNLDNNGTTGQGGGSFKNLLNNGISNQQYVPFDGYYEYDMTLQLQDAFNMPLGETTTVNQDGSTTKKSSWFSPLSNGGKTNASLYAKQLRGDIDVRSDLLQISEGYWRSQQRIGIINYITLEGIPDQQIVTDNIIKDFLIENDIKTLRKVTLEEIEDDPQPNTIAFTYVPQVRWGAKINSGNSFLNDHIYLGGDPIEYQIKGDSNLYDMKLPVAGIIGNSIAKKLRPFIVMYNICMNQIFNLLEKEIGTFLLFDVNYLPSEYKDNIGTKETLEMLREAAVEIGIVPIDTKKQNMQGAGQGMNTFMSQSITFTDQINNRMALAERYKLLGLEQIGINPQRMGSASEYTTAEGIKQGLTASYAQTEPIFSAMSTANKKANHVHLVVAQHCQKNYKDVAYYYTNSDGDKSFIELSDPYFPLRHFGIVPTNNSNDKKELENLKSMMLQNNTQGSDLQDFAQIVKSKSIIELLAVGKQNRIDAQKELDTQRAHEQELKDKELASIKAEKDADRAYESLEKQKDRDNIIEREEISALGRASDKDANQESFDRIQDAAKNDLQNSLKFKEMGIKEKQADLKEQERTDSKGFKDRELKLKEEVLRVQREKMKSDENISIRNKN